MSSKLRRSGKMQSNNPNALLMLFLIVNVLLTCFAGSAKLETQMKLLINDDELLLQQQQQRQHDALSVDGDPANTRSGPFNLYHSELKRLSYETIHRILRDENEPMYRREDSELRYYQKRSSQPTHEVVRRSTGANDMHIESNLNLSFLNLSRLNLIEFPGAYEVESVDKSVINEIDLSVNRLQHVNIASFPQLKVLNLSHNEIHQLPLTENDTLIKLILNSNKIQKGVAPTNSFLHELHLNDNGIENPASFNLSALSSLDTLDLSCNKIKELIISFFPPSMRNLKYLNLAHNQIVTVSRETFYNLLSLNTLLLAGNNISDIDYETFLALPNLQYLDLSHNHLKGEAIRALQGIPDLEGLSIAYNPKVGASMQEFVASWSLKELDASGIGLCQIPAALAQSVRTLKLTDNWIKVISCGDLDSYPLLQYLDLSNSHIEDIEDDALGRLEILEVLFLDHNNLRKVPISLPTSLEHVFLHNNQIMDIQPQTFQLLHNLQTLDLSCNKLLYLPALPLPKLLTLNLQSSGLTTLSTAIVHTLPRLRDLMLEDNPIRCSELMSVVEWAGPCRILERTNAMIVTEANEENDGKIRDTDLGQLSEAKKIDLKEQFLRMHNFYEHFESACKDAKSVNSGNNPLFDIQPPACVNELYARNKKASSDTGKTKIINFNLPSRQPSLVSNPSLMATTGVKVQEFNQEKAPPAETAKISQESQHNKADGVSNETSTNIVLTHSEIPLQDAKTSSESTSTIPSQMPIGVSEAETQAISEAVAQEDGRSAKGSNRSNLFGEYKTTEQTAQMISEHRVAAATMSVSDASYTPVAMNFEKPRHSSATIQAIQAHATTWITSTSSLNSTERISQPENSNPTTATNDTSTTTATTALYSPNSETVFMPQTISTTIKSENNFVETSSSSLLNSMRFTTSAAIATGSAEFETFEPTINTVTEMTITTPSQVKDLTQKQTQHSNGNVDIDDGKSSKRIGTELIDSSKKAITNSQENIFERAHSNRFYDISGQKNSTSQTEPTTERTILAAVQHNIVQSESFPPTASTVQRVKITTKMPPPHKHEPLQLHIRDRHLIGTPLLMHKGENILVEADQLIFPNRAATTTKRPNTMKNFIKEKANVAKSLEHSQLFPLRRDERIGHSMGTTVREENKWQKPMVKEAHFNDKNEETEAINDKTNDHNTNDAARLLAIHTDKQLTSDTEIAKTSNEETAGRRTSEEADSSASPKKNVEKKKLSLTMKKMTITTKHSSNSQKQTYTLNMPREKELPLHSLDTRYDHEPDDKLTSHKHSTVNTPISAHQQHEPSTFSSSQQYESLIKTDGQNPASHANEKLLKSEQWLDLRKATTATNHPGVVILLSFSLFIVLLVGLMHVYRCEMPWRRHLPRQRPHQRHFSDDDIHSFLNYQCNPTPRDSKKNSNLNKREDPPYLSPLHNLYVHELQRTSAVDDKTNQSKQLKHSVVRAPSIGSGSSDASQSSCPTSSHSSPILEHDNFYIEMTPDSGQTSGTLHSDLLPMELLSGQSMSRHSTTHTTIKLHNDLLRDTQNPSSKCIPGTHTADFICTDVPATDRTRTKSSKSMPTSRKFSFW